MTNNTSAFEEAISQAEPSICIENLRLVSFETVQDDNLVYHGDTKKGYYGASAISEVHKKSPMHYFYSRQSPSETTKSMLFGTSVHKILESAPVFDMTYVALSEKHDGRTKAGIAETEDYVNQGFEPMKAKDYKKAKSLAEQCQKHPVISTILSRVGKWELSFYIELVGDFYLPYQKGWFRNHPIKLKIRPDFLPDTKNYYVSVKTSLTAKISENTKKHKDDKDFKDERNYFGAEIVKHAYHVKESFYMDMLELCGLTNHEKCIFIVLENGDAPIISDGSITKIDKDTGFVSEFYTVGRIAWQQALCKIIDCEQSNKWIAYEGIKDTDVAGIHEILPPYWFNKEY